jgi:hypothetical protein
MIKFKFTTISSAGIGMGSFFLNRSFISNLHKYMNKTATIDNTKVAILV